MESECPTPYNSLYVPVKLRARRTQFNSTFRRKLYAACMELHVRSEKKNKKKQTVSDDNMSEQYVNLVDTKKGKDITRDDLIKSLAGKLREMKDSKINRKQRSSSRRRRIDKEIRDEMSRRTDDSSAGRNQKDGQNGVESAKKPTDEEFCEFETFSQKATERRRRGERARTDSESSSKSSNIELIKTKIKLYVKGLEELNFQISRIVPHPRNEPFEDFIVEKHFNEQQFDDLTPSKNRKKPDFDKPRKPRDALPETSRKTRTRRRDSDVNLKQALSHFPVTRFTFRLSLLLTWHCDIEKSIITDLVRSKSLSDFSTSASKGLVKDLDSIRNIMPNDNDRKVESTKEQPCQQSTNGPPIPQGLTGVAKSVYIGVCNFAKAEEQVEKRSDFRVYHQLVHRPLLDDLEQELPLIVVYKTANGSFRHYPIRRRKLGTSSYYYVDYGDPKVQAHASLDHLVRYYQINAQRHPENRQYADQFPWWEVHL
ncbi:hypothetical protein DICVIV_01544 [Dictyocaulus viviparus]|uniref:SH2 domain protein n=1 Tax=Dictyocaulus viviparus TaxID=29172 RepID=A0A0D8YCC6_DICVI|nr:hypothetical protein DICVIV_01544 [Dictyocaulus viviparus]